MKRSMVLIFGIAAAAGCATAGPVPLGDPSDDLRTAQQMIQAAEAAGADSVPFAAAQLAAARAALTEATDERGESANWASLKAREAAAKASYARALAEKSSAEARQRDAREALGQIPPGGVK